MDSFMDNGLFAKENNILPYIFTEEERSDLYKEISAGGMMAILEMVQSDNDILSLNIGGKICLLLIDVDSYMKKIESRDSIYSRVYKECKNLTFNKFLYELTENDSQYDFKSNWRKYLESAEEIAFCKSKTHLNDEELSRLLSIMEKTFIDEKEIEREDDIFLNSIMDESKFQCWVACFLTSIYYIIIHEEKEQLPDSLNEIIILSVKLTVEKNKSLYNRWLKAVGKNGIRNQIKVLSQKLFEKDPTDRTILSVFLLYYYQKSYSDGGDYLFTELIDFYCDTMVKKLNFEEFLREHQYGKVFCEEYKSYCSSHQIEPRININSILMLLERDDPSYNKKRYYRLSEKRISNNNGDLSDEYNALSKLYDALKEQGCSPKEECKQLFVYRFSGICLQGSQIDREFGLENKMEWEWSKKQILPVIIRLLYQEGTMGHVPYTDIASFFKNENSNSFSSKCKHVGKKSLSAICDMLKQCGFTGFDDIYQHIIGEKEYSKKKHP